MVDILTVTGAQSGLIKEGGYLIGAGLDGCVVKYVSKPPSKRTIKKVLRMSKRRKMRSALYGSSYLGCGVYSVGNSIENRE